MPRLEPFPGRPGSGFRRAAIVGLGKSIEPSVLPGLRPRRAGTPSPQALVAQARRKIAAIQARDLRAYVNAIIESDEYYDLIRMLEVAWEHVAEIMVDRERSPVVRRRAVRLLYLARVPMAKEPLTKIVAGEDELLEVRLQAVVGVGRCRAQEAVEPLIKLLDNPDASLRDAAITSLGQIGKPRALDPLLSKWDARGGALRGMTLLAIRRLCAKSGTVLLTDLLEQNGELVSHGIYFIDDSLALTREYRNDYVNAELKSPEAEARRDAALLLAFFGKRSDAGKLALMGKIDPDATNREIALKGYSKLLKLSR
ncbi:MAG: HEAT repeat domain-containing protein [Pyrinomonadaceae bacterium]